MNKHQEKWLNSFNGHDERMLERLTRFNRKPRAKRTKKFHMSYTTKAGKVRFSIYSNIKRK